MDLQQIFSQTITARALRKDFSKTLGRFGLIYGEFEVLYLLLSDKSLQPSSITAHLQCQPAATSRIIKSLHQKELVEYNHDADDRRQVYVALSAEGKSLIGDLKKKSQA